MAEIINHFTKYLKGDIIEENYPRQVLHAHYSTVKPVEFKAPKTILTNKSLANELGLQDLINDSNSWNKLVIGQLDIKDVKPYSLCYGGHQFGHWAGQLGDGRAINLGEVISNNSLNTIQLKGAGPTPYSRTADGFAVLRSSIREYICSEAMFHLGVPTTRSLALTLTGEEVWRDLMYNGNPKKEKGAVVVRTSPSFVRFGNFELLSYNKDIISLQTLSDYIIENHYVDISNTPDKYLHWFQAISDRTASLISHWMSLGFVHGVMNTDNMSIIGETIDYGPFGWLESYSPHFTPNTSDLPERRYQYINQPMIAQWNVFKLGIALLPLIKDSNVVKQVIESFPKRYMQHYKSKMLEKLGLPDGVDRADQLIEKTLSMLENSVSDYTIFFRNLSSFDVNKNQEEKLSLLLSSQYLQKENKGLRDWLIEYNSLLVNKYHYYDANTRKNKMDSVNPKYIANNYILQEVIDAAESGDYGPLNEVSTLIKRPFIEQNNMEKYSIIRPKLDEDKLNYNMLSCSS